MSKPRIVVVGTGGTIASRYDPVLGGHVSAATAADLVAAVPELADVADLKIVEHSNVNSALMDTATAFGVRDTLRRELADPGVAGAVITHGTATLEETAYLVDLTLGTDKPVVITGAQRNFDEKDPDGPRNLLYAAMIAAHPEAGGRGVLVALGGQIHSARDATKIDPEAVTCFGSRDGGPIGAVNKQAVTFFAMPQRRVFLDVDRVADNVQIVRMGQGTNDLLLRACIRERVDGIVLEATAGGNVNRPWFDAVCDALEAGIPVVVALRLAAGAPHPGKGYAGSFQSMAARGAIASGHLSGLKARILLMVALAKTRDRNELDAIFRQAGGG